MKENKSYNECPSCKGELELEGTFWRSYRRNFRFDRFRCKECGHPLEKEIDIPIEKTFPKIRDISIEVFEEGGRGSTRYTKNFISEHLSICSNPKCTTPGIYIEQILREMIEKRDSHQEIWKGCDGFEPSPKGRKKKPCDRMFKITIDIVLDGNGENGV